jgi:hypothetical protein
VTERPAGEQRTGSSGRCPRRARPPVHAVRSATRGAGRHRRCPPPGPPRRPPGGRRWDGGIRWSSGRAKANARAGTRPTPARAVPPAREAVAVDLDHARSRRQRSPRGARGCGRWPLVAESRRRVPGRVDAPPPQTGSGPVPPRRPAGSSTVPRLDGPPSLARVGAGPPRLSVVVPTPRRKRCLALAGPGPPRGRAAAEPGRYARPRRRLGDAMQLVPADGVWIALAVTPASTSCADETTPYCSSAIAAITWSTSSSAQFGKRWRRKSVTHACGNRGWAIPGTVITPGVTHRRVRTVWVTKLPRLRGQPPELATQRRLRGRPVTPLSLVVHTRVTHRAIS